MKKMMLVIGLIAGMLLISMGGDGVRAEDELMDEMDFSYGIVVSITGTKIVIREYDYDTEQEKNETYVINEFTQFINMDNVMEIEIGDEVDINYVDQSGTKIAKIITKEVIGEPLSEIDDEIYDKRYQEQSYN